MRPYVAVVAARFRVLLQYRAAALAGIGTQVFWGFIRVMIFTGFYRSTTAPQPMELPDVITYVWLGQALLMLLPWRSDPETEALVRTGNVAYELLRPVDLYGLWYGRSLAWRTGPTALRALPLLAVALPFLGLRPPAGVTAAVAFSVTLAGAVLLSAALTTLITISQMWTISGRGAYMMLSAAAWILSGMLLPLPIFPDWARPVVEFLPFRAIMDTPFRLWTGDLPAEALPGLLLHQLGWTAAIVLLGRRLLGRGRRHLVVQGG